MCGPSHTQRMLQEWLLLAEARAAHSWAAVGISAAPRSGSGAPAEVPTEPHLYHLWLGDPNEGFKCSGLQFLLQRREQEHTLGRTDFKRSQRSHTCKRALHPPGPGQPPESPQGRCLCVGAWEVCERDQAGSQGLCSMLRGQGRRVPGSHFPSEVWGPEVPGTLREATFQQLGLQEEGKTPKASQRAIHGCSGAPGLQGSRHCPAFTRYVCTHTLLWVYCFSKRTVNSVGLGKAACRRPLKDPKGPECQARVWGLGGLREGV